MAQTTKRAIAASLKRILEQNLSLPLEYNKTIEKAAIAHAKTYSQEFKPHYSEYAQWGFMGMLSAKHLDYWFVNASWFLGSAAETNIMITVPPYKHFDKEDWAKTTQVSARE